MDLDELERRARDRMEPAAYDYYAGGAESETTLRDNVAAWDGALVLTVDSGATTPRSWSTAACVAGSTC